MEPVKKSEAPDYYEIIRFPIGEQESVWIIQQPLNSSWFYCLGHDHIIRSSLNCYCSHWWCFFPVSPHRPENHDGETEEQILCDQEAFHCRPAANHHQLSWVQPSGQRVLQECQHLGEVLLLQIKRRRLDREMNSATELFTKLSTKDDDKLTLAVVLSY